MISSLATFRDTSLSFQLQLTDSAKAPTQTQLRRSFALFFFSSAVPPTRARKEGYLPGSTSANFLGKHYFFANWIWVKNQFLWFNLPQLMRIDSIPFILLILWVNWSLYLLTPWFGSLHIGPFRISVTVIQSSGIYLPGRCLSSWEHCSRVSHTFKALPPTHGSVT